MKTICCLAYALNKGGGGLCLMFILRMGMCSVSLGKIPCVNKLTARIYLIANLLNIVFDRYRAAHTLLTDTGLPDQ